MKIEEFDGCTIVFMQWRLLEIVQWNIYYSLMFAVRLLAIANSSIACDTKHYYYSGNAFRAVMMLD